MNRPGTSGLDRVAALLLVISLGLPWGTQSSWVWGAPPPFVIPLWNGFGGGYCCISVTSSFSGSQLASQVVFGAQHAARFGVVAALAMLLLAPQRARLWAAAVVLAELLLSGGLGFTASGVAAAWFAVLLLAGQRFAAGRS